MSLGRNTVKGIGLFSRIAWGQEESLVWDRGETKPFKARERREVAMLGVGIRHFE